MIAQSGYRIQPEGPEEDLFRQAFDRAHVGLAVCEPEGRVLVLNEALCRMVGSTRESLVTHSWECFITFESNEVEGTAALMRAAAGTDLRIVSSISRVSLRSNRVSTSMVLSPSAIRPALLQPQEPSGRR